MQYQFHQALRLKGKVFGLGVHEIPEAIENDLHFLKYVGAGYISEVKKVAQVKFQAPKEKAEALLNKLREKAVKKATEKKAK